MFRIFSRAFNINLKDYKNIGIDLEISKILLCFAVLLILVTLFMSLKRNVMVSVIKRLHRLEAFNENEAKTLTELKFTGFYAFICRGLIRGSGRLKRLISRAGEKKYTYNQYIKLSRKEKKEYDKIDFSTARFYLKDKNSADTKNLLDSKTSSLVHTLLFCLLIVSVYICLVFLMPEILNLINSMLA